MSRNSTLLALSAVVAVTSGCPKDGNLEDLFATKSYNVNTVGIELNDRFSDLAYTCGVIPKSVFDNYAALRDFVPSDVSSSSVEMDKLAAKQDWHPTLLFLYPFTQAEQDAAVAAVGGGTFPVLRPERLVKETTATGAAAFRTDLLPTKKGGINATLYRQSCASYVTADSTAGASFPIASVSAALDSEFSRSSVVSVVTGYFESPFYTLMQDPGPAGLYARLLVWDRYQQIEAAAGGKIKLDSYRQLTGFLGAIVASGTVAGKNTKVDLATQVGASGGVGSASFESTASFENGADFTEDTNAVLLMDIAQTSFVPLPDVTAIVAFAREYGKTASFVTPPRAMTDVGQHDHTIRLLGVTDKVCRDQWTVANVSPGVYQQTPVAKPAPFTDSTSGLPGCDLTLTGTPIQAATAAKKTLLVSYDVVSSSGLTDDLGLHSLSFSVKNLPIATDPSPEISFLEGRRDTTDQPGNKIKFKWQSQAQISAGPVKIAYTASAPITITSAVCGAAGYVELSATLVPDAATSSMRAEYQTVRSYDPVQKGWGEVACQADGSVNVPTIGDNTVTRPVRLVFAMPLVPPKDTDRTNTFEAIHKFQTDLETIESLPK
jgi:hypothetical protein